VDEFPANSRNPVEREVAKPAGRESIEPKKIEKITTGEVHLRKKSLGKRFAETFFGGTAKGAAQYVVLEVLLPTAKDAIFDAFSQGVERFLFGDSRGGGRRTINRHSPVSGHNGYVSYNRYADPRGPSRREREEPRALSKRARANHELDEIVVASRAEANAVLARMAYIIDTYDVCSISDLYKMVDIAPEFTDEKWGWTSTDQIDDAKPVRVNGGYVLDLPKPVPID
jgi:hypothetical protein